MIKEYCDRCGNQIKVGESYKDENGDELVRDSRIEIIVNSSSQPMPKESWNDSKDVLCPQCAKEWRYTN